MIDYQLSDQELEERINKYRLVVDEVVVMPDEGATFKYVVPNSVIGENLIDVIRNPEGRIMTGLRDLDVIMRGLGKGELAYVVGYTTSGKTQAFLNMVHHNADKYTVLFTMDEPAEMVLSKLIAMDERWNFKWVEEQVKEGNQDVLAKIRRAASEKYRKLLVVDLPMNVNKMSEALREAERFFGVEHVDLVGIDYLRLLGVPESEDGQGIARRSVALKAWVQEERVPCMCIHQGGRGKSSKGRRIELDSMEYGGEMEAHFIIGVRRLKNDEELDEFERQQHENTVNISLVKSKRLPPRLGEFTFLMNPDYGLITDLHVTDIPIREAF